MTFNCVFSAKGLNTVSYVEFCVDSRYDIHFCLCWGVYEISQDEHVHLFSEKRAKIAKMMGVGVRKFNVAPPISLIYMLTIYQIVEYQMGCNIQQK